MLIETKPPYPRRRGEHGPSRRRQDVERAIARRLDVDPDADEWQQHIRAARLDRDRERAARRAFAARWPHWAYLFYRDLRRYGFCEELIGRVVSSVRDPLPPELDDLPVRSRMHLSPARVARWAYLGRVHGLTFEAIVELEYEAGLQRQQSSQAALHKIEARRRAIASGLLGNPEERAYLESLASLTRHSAEHEPDRLGAAAIRMAVRRYRPVWELADSRALLPLRTWSDESF